MYVIGINAYHADSSACLIENGELKFAIEEERLNRVKHWAGFPAEAIKACLDHVGASIEDIDCIAINTLPNKNIGNKIKYALRYRPSLALILDRVSNTKKRANVLKDINEYFSTNYDAGRIAYVEHHLAHLASSHYSSGFRDSLSVSIDGFGDFSSSAWGQYSDQEFKLLGNINFPHSLGIFYQAITQFIGFKNYGDEYKVMGLAPYGKPLFLDEVRDMINWDGKKYALNLKYFRHWKEGFSYNWNGGVPTIGDLFNEQFENLFGIPARGSDEALLQVHSDIAHSCQVIYEETLFQFLENLYHSHPNENLTLSGGCAMNSVANGKITENTSFNNVYIPASAGDAGGAVGAAMIAMRRLNKKTIFKNVSTAYLGARFATQEIKDSLLDYEERFSEQNCVVREYVNDDALCEFVATNIAEGKVVGWFQGATEWGPRALGNRSILGDPRRQDMKDILNLKIKRRESFRPFAPSILRGSVDQWFEKSDDVPYMMQVFKFKKEKRELIKAVCHVDGSGRLHTVDSHTNPKYFKLISKFEEKTGVPILLNTSFNENEPIVNKPQHAIDCFLRTNMDVLVLENYVVVR